MPFYSLHIFVCVNSIQSIVYGRISDAASVLVRRYAATNRQIDKPINDKTSNGNKFIQFYLNACYYTTRLLIGWACRTICDQRNVSRQFYHYTRMYHYYCCKQIRRKTRDQTINALNERRNCVAAQGVFTTIATCRRCSSLHLQSSSSIAHFLPVDNNCWQPKPHNDGMQWPCGHVQPLLRNGGLKWQAHCGNSSQRVMRDRNVNMNMNN